jgi:mannan endo-1,4-beta-mannosidase
MEVFQLEKIISKKHLTKLANPDASKEAMALISYFIDIYGKRILSGQHEAEFPYRPELDRIQALTGKLPAIRSMDFLNYSSSMDIEGWKGFKDDVTERAMDWYNNKNGIVTLCWHWYSPIGGNPGSKSFYTKETSFDLTKALKFGTKENQALMNDLDIIAGELARLRDAHVPVLWRPLHEADGGWFWWGAQGAEPCKELYWLMYDLFINQYKLNNLIWVWTFTGNGLAKDWYPGDDYVDIVGIDKYYEKGDYNPNIEGFKELVSFAGERKLITMPENGGIPDPDRLVGEKAGWLWFCTWWGEFITDEEWNNEEHIKKVFHHPYVITLDQLPNLRDYVGQS